MISSLIRRLFPCRYNELRCQDNWWGCRCGKGGSKKAERRADDLARQQAAQAAMTQKAVETKTAPTPQEQERINTMFGLEQRQQPLLEARAAATPEDLYRQLGPVSAQYAQGVEERAGQTPSQLFSNVSPEAAQLAQYISQRFGMSPAELLGGISPAALSLQSRITQDVTTPQTIPFEDTFLPEYKLLQQNVLGDANARGFGTGSGLTIEQLGRAGVDLAIKQAALRQQNAQINQALRQQSLENAAQLAQTQYGLKQEATGQQEGLVQAQQSLADQARQQALGLSESSAGLSSQARQELASYLANLQSLSEAARGRQTQGVVQSYAAAEPFQSRAGQFQGVSLDALQNRVQQSQQGTQAIAKSVADAAAIAAAPFTGGMSLYALPVINSMGSSGQQQPSYGSGGGYFPPPGSAGGLLSGMRQANVAQQPFYGAGWNNPSNGPAGQVTPEQLAQIYGQQQRKPWGRF